MARHLQEAHGRAGLVYCALLPVVETPSPANPMAADRLIGGKTSLKKKKPNESPSQQKTSQFAGPPMRSSTWVLAAPNVFIS